MKTKISYAIFLAACVLAASCSSSAETADGTTSSVGSLPFVDAPVESLSGEKIVISGVGDVNVDPEYLPIFRQQGYDYSVSGMDDLFLEDDLTVINLECPASAIAGEQADKEFTFRCDVDALASLRSAGVDVASQANNHSLDYGAAVLLDSITNLTAAGIEPVGAGSNAEQANQPAVFDIKGQKVAVLGFGGVVPSPDWHATTSRPGMSDGYSIASMVDAVKAADELADLVVVTIHWGEELQPGPPEDDVERAEAMIDAGADVIFGHHPHRLNSLDFYKGKPIAWSLGNFIWPKLSAEGSDTAVAQVIVDTADGSIKACFLDVTITDNGHPELDDPDQRRC